MKKKGFTLIELLAVIIILAIIALIATPVVLNVINAAKKDAFKASVEGIIDSIEYKTLDDMLVYEIKEVTYRFPSEDLAISGTQPTGGYITLNEEKKSSVFVYNDDYCVTKEIDAQALTIEQMKGSSCETYIDSTKAFGFDEETGTITSYDVSYGTDIVIPYSINGVIVREIADSAFIDSYTHEIAVINDTETRECAYNYNSEYGMEGCFYEYTYEYALANNIPYDYLKRVTFTDEPIKKCKHIDSEELIEVSDDKIFSVEDGYINCTYKNYNIPASETLSSVDFSHATGLERIGSYAFYGNNISVVKFNNPNLIEIGASSFSYNAIGTLDFSSLENLKTIDYAAFNVNSLATLDLSPLKHLTKIGKAAFYVNNLTNVIFENPKLEVIGSLAFSDNALTTLDLSSEINLKRIEQGAFSNCALSDVTFENPNLETIGYMAFVNNAIEELDLSSETNLKGIATASFASNNINNLIFNNPNLNYIGQYAFAMNNIPSLDLTSATNLKQIDKGAFIINELQRINVGPSKELEIGYNAFLKASNGNYQLKTIINDTGNSYDWSSITIYSDTNNSSGNIFETGVIIHPYGNITVIKD